MRPIERQSDQYPERVAMMRTAVGVSQYQMQGIQQQTKPGLLSDSFSPTSEFGNFQDSIPQAPASSAGGGGGAPSSGMGSAPSSGMGAAPAAPVAPAAGGGKPNAKGILPQSQGLYDTIMQAHPDLNIGGYRVDNYHEHDNGALDVMTSDPNVAKDVREKAFAAGAPYVLWQQRQWNADGTSSPMEDRGSPTQNHMDHVHTAPIKPRSK